MRQTFSVNAGSRQVRATHRLSGPLEASRRGWSACLPSVHPGGYPA